MSSDSEKVFAPTARRRQQMREEGHVVMSRDLVNAATLFVAALVFFGFGESLVAVPFSGLENCLGQEPWTQMTVDGFMQYWYDWMKILMVGFFPFLLLLPATILLTGFLQTRFLFLTSNLLPDWKKVNPVTGLARVFSWNSCVIALLGLCKIALLASVFGWIVVSQLDDILMLPTLSLPEAVRTLSHFVLLTGVKVAGVLLVLALADYGWQYWKHEQELRMTLQEMREEMRATEGDPQLKAKMRQRM